MKRYLYSCLFLLPFWVAAQKYDPEQAKEHFKHNNFSAALIDYNKCLKFEPENPDFLFKAAYCVLHLAVDKSAAIPYLEKAVKHPKVDNEAFYFLGLAYHINHKFDEAAEYYLKYKSIGKGSNIKNIDRQLSMLENARKLTAAPVDVTFQNLGTAVNSTFPDYYPFITPDESYLVFTSRRKGKGGKEFDGYYPSDVYETRVKEGEFETVKMAPTINGIYDEQVVGLSYDAQTLFLYIDNIEDYGDIFQVNVKNGKYSKPVKMGEIVNSKDFESSASISADGNTLFFSSNRKGGLGGKDIWMTRKLPNGEWALPQNLGPNINTEYDEDFPNLFYDGKTLYFSSNGRNSIGGYDLFKSEWNEESNEWSFAENLGYPINTCDDNMVISFTEDQRHAYVSMWREDTQGDLDIYRLTYNELDEKQTVFKSQLIDAGNKVYVKNAFITATDNRTMREVGQYIPNQKTGNFVMILKPGSYQIVIDAPGYATLKKDIVIKGKSDFEDMIMQEFELIK